MYLYHHNDLALNQPKYTGWHKLVFLVGRLTIHGHSSHPTNDKIIFHVQRRLNEKTEETSKDTKPYLKC